MNLLELEDITEDDVMTPRSQIEAIDIEDDPERMRQQISTSHHTRLVVHAGSSDNLLGVLHVRRVLHALTGKELDPATLRDNLETPYFVPAGTPLFTQLRNFQSSRRRLVLVVDEYGELQGLVTLEDLLEELVGEFTTQAPSDAGYLRREEDGSWLVEGSGLLRRRGRGRGRARPRGGPGARGGRRRGRGGGGPEAGGS